MGNCAGPKQSRSNKASKKIVLQKGQQVVTYNGVNYVINMKEIFDGRNEDEAAAQQIDLKSINQYNSNNNAQPGYSEARKPCYPNRQKEDSVYVNGKQTEFILQTFQSSSLIARRAKNNMCETRITSAHALSNFSPSPKLLFSAPNLMAVQAAS